MNMASHAATLRPGSPRPTSERVTKSALLLVPDNKVVPASFVEALKQGWKVISENTVLAMDKRHRHGKVFLAKAGSSNLVVSYTGTIKQGYRFGKPRLLN
jgi:hypothetical protein